MNTDWLQCQHYKPNIHNIFQTKLLHTTGFFAASRVENGQLTLIVIYIFLILDMCHEATITIQPTLARIYSEGTDLTLYCECPSNSNEKTITWIKNGAKVTPHSRQSITSDGKKLMLKNVKFADSGKYACNVTVDRMVTATAKELELWGTTHKFYRWKCIFSKD